jgi:hypothetical protein
MFPQVHTAIWKRAMQRSGHAITARIPFSRELTDNLVTGWKILRGARSVNRNGTHLRPTTLLDEGK